MLRSSSQLSDDLARRLRSLDKTRQKIMLLHNNRQISRIDLEHTYEGLFLNAHVAFEGFIEDLFIGLLVTGQGLQSSRIDILPRVTVRTHKIAREMMLGSGKQYIDWFPYKRTIELAEIYFRGGRPFSELNQTQKDYLSRCHIIRNAIAHKSRYSLKQFEDKVIGNAHLLPRERSPAGYLSGIFRTSPVQTRYENFAAQLLLIARHLAV
jgi:hypothetical protein